MNVHSSKYKCAECEKCFSSNTVLARHKQTHSGEKPFECTVCSKQFTRLNNLEVHSFCCGSCGKFFKSKETVVVKHLNRCSGIMYFRRSFVLHFFQQFLSRGGYKILEWGGKWGP